VTAATRLYFIVARKSPVAVVFRRGPTRQVELLRWDLATDQLTAGQWLKGRIYERRCDLSPSGDKLIYFAARYETSLRTWTAVSRPPHLTALAFWPKGDAWGGGGLFDNEHRIRLNHRPNEMMQEEGFRLAPSMEIVPLGEHPGWGEDDPIHHVRLRRDGWRKVGPEPKVKATGWDSDPWIVFDPVSRYTRSVGPPLAGLKIEMTIRGLKERDGPWYVTSYRLLTGNKVLRDIGRADWADNAPNSDLLLAREGRLWRLQADSIEGWAQADFLEVADLREHRFEARVAPEQAVRW
jgi:hypothetical protein